MIPTEDVKLIHETELSELISATYGRPYRLQQHGYHGSPMGQDTMVRISVPTGEWFGDVALADWLARVPSEPMSFDERLDWERRFYPPLAEIVTDLHARGLLDAGEYVVHVWW